jgi:hypothetical protein
LIAGARALASLDDLNLDLSDEDAALTSGASAVQLQMGIRSGEVTYHMAEDVDLNASGIYCPGTKPEIWIARSIIQDPLQLVTTLAHELSHHWWLHQEEPSAADYDERMTDLTPICFGFGVLMSESALYDSSWSDGGYHYHTLQRFGYLNAQEFGFGIAMFMALRSGDERWEKLLRPDARETARAARKHWDYLRPEKIVLAALWRLAGMLHAIDPWLESIQKLVQSVDLDIAVTAVRLLAKAKKSAAQPIIVRAIGDRRDRVAVAATVVASDLEIDLSPHVRHLEHLLERCQHDPVNLLDAIRRQGLSMEYLVEPIIYWLTRAHHAVDDQKANAMIRCLLQISPSTNAAITQFVSDEQTRIELKQRLLGPF